jgi:hypothetical protein
LEKLAPIVFLVRLAVAGIGILFMYFAIVEFIAVRLFKYSFFGFGKLVYAESDDIPLPVETIYLQQVIKTENGKFKFVNEKECLFCERIKLWPPSFYPPFPLKGKIRWRNGIAEIEGRIYLGISVFLGSWFILWTAGAFMLLASDPAAFFSEVLVIFIMGWLFAGGIYFLSIRYAIRCTKNIVAAIKEYLTRGAVFLKPVNHSLQSNEENSSFHFSD